MISIGFENPTALVLSIPFLATLVLLYRRSRKKFSTIVERLGLARSPKLVALLTALKLCTAIAIAIAAAQPYLEIYEPVKVSIDNVLELNTSAVELLILLDVSKSMGYVDNGIKRFEIATKVLEELLRIVKRDRVTVAVFAKDVEIVCRNASISCLNKLQSIELRRYSAIGNAIVFAVSYAKASSLPVAAILITDGANNYGTPPKNALRYANESGLALVPIIVGSDPRAYDFEKACRDLGIEIRRVGTHVDEKLLKDLVEDAYREAKYVALKVRGMLYAYVAKRDYGPTLVATILALVLFLASILEGV